MQNPILILSVLCLVPFGDVAGRQDRDQDKDAVSLKDYGISEKHPYGRANPKAPIELRQFEFMVGEFDRKERRRRRDGSWGPWTRGEWNARYIMNGYAILDESFNHDTKVVTSNMRFYDAKTKEWKITWFKAPGFSTTTAEGNLDDTELVCVNKGTKDRYVFYNIEKNSYDWKLY